MVIITMVLLNIINNYWTRLGKISWFVRGEQINYLPQPSASANNWSARHWQITIFCDNRVQELFYHLITEFVFFNEYPRETKRSAIFTQRRSQEGEKHGFLYACAQYNLQQLDGIAHEQTIICRQFFCRSRGGLSANEKKEKFASNDKRGLTFLEFNLLTPSCSLITRSPLPETIVSRSESISLIISGSVRSNCTTASKSSLFEVEESPERPSVHDPWVVQYWKQTRQSWARFDIIFAGKRWLLLVDPGSAASSNKLSMKTTKH